MYRSIIYTTVYGGIREHAQTERIQRSQLRSVHVYVYIYYITVSYVLALGDSARRRRWDDREKEGKEKRKRPKGQRRKLRDVEGKRKATGVVKTREETPT